MSSPTAPALGDTCLRIELGLGSSDLFSPLSHIPGLAPVTAPSCYGPLDRHPDLSKPPVPAPGQLLSSSFSPHPPEFPGQTRNWSTVSCWPMPQHVPCRPQRPESHLRQWKQHRLCSQKNLKFHLGKTLPPPSLSFLICIMGLKG